MTYLCLTCHIYIYILCLTSVVFLGASLTPLSISPSVLLIAQRKEQRARSQHRESCGVQLYERQLQLARQQQQQQQLQQRLAAAAAARAAAEEALGRTRRQHSEIGEKLQADRERGARERGREEMDRRMTTEVLFFFFF